MLRLNTTFFNALAAQVGTSAADASIIILKHLLGHEEATLKELATAGLIISGTVGLGNKILKGEPIGLSEMVRFGQTIAHYILAATLSYGFNLSTKTAIALATFVGFGPNLFLQLIKTDPQLAGEIRRYIL